MPPANTTGTPAMKSEPTNYMNKDSIKELKEYQQHALRTAPIPASPSTWTPI
jgi:hypothetical protein